MASINCKLCGSSKYKILSQKKAYAQDIVFKLLQCLDCGLAFVDPLPSNSQQGSHYGVTKVVSSTHDLARFNKKVKRLNLPFIRFILQVLKGYKFYSFKTNLFLKILFSPLSLIMLKNIIPYRGQGRILDVGCNDGLTLGIYKSLGWETFGVEPGPLFAKAAEKLGINVFCGSLEEAVFPPKYFDVIRFNQVFEHLLDPVAALKKAKGLLSDNGQIYIEVPNQRSFSFYFLRDEFYSYPMHLNIFSPHTMRLLCRKVGLKVRKVRIRSSMGLLYDRLQRRYSASQGVIKKITQPFMNWRFVKVFFIKPFCSFCNILGFGDIFEVRISK